MRGSDLSADLISKIEDFVYHIATTEPDKYQLYYCLGFFNWKVKGDTVQAAKDFKTFLDLRQESRFDKEAKLVTKSLAEIESAEPYERPA